MAEVQAVKGGTETLGSVTKIVNGEEKGVILAITIGKNGESLVDLCSWLPPTLAKEVLQEALDSIPEVKEPAE